MGSDVAWNPDLWTAAGGDVPPDWDLIPFGDLLQSPKSITVGVMYPGQHTDGGAPLIRVGDVIGGGTVQATSMAIAPAVHHEYRRTELSGDELLITLVGTPGVCILAQPRMKGWNVARALAVARMKAPELRPYIKAVLESSVMRNIILSMLNTTVQPTLNLKEIKILPVPMPRDHGVARALGGVAELFNQRIALLHQTNTTLEAIAQALFKSWFVDFDPVHAKAEGREPEAMDTATAALFPSEFEESELGLIPKGWSVERLSDLVELAYGKALKANDRVPGEIPVYGSGGVTGWHNVALVTEPTIIIGRKGSVGTIYWEDRPCHPIDTVFFVRSQKVPLTLCLQVLRSLGLDKMNTDAAVPGLNRENAYRLEVVAAATAVNDAWHKIAEPIYDAMSNNSRRCEVLSQLRDTLLPRLISGKLRLPESVDTAGEALA